MKTDNRNIWNENVYTCMFLLFLVQLSTGRGSIIAIFCLFLADYFYIIQYIILNTQLF
jgi:hypothetical protein